MKPILAALFFAATPLFAQNRPGARRVTPEQYPGQLARLRLELMYPKLVPETTRSPAADPAGRLADFLADSVPVLKNVRGLTDYLYEGLRDPRAVEGAREWDVAWKRLDEETGRLTSLVAEGEALLGERVPSPDGKPETDGRLRRALILAARAQSLRERLIRKSADLSAARAKETARSALP